KILFNKQGIPGGHITITKNGKIVVDKEFTTPEELKTCAEQGGVICKPNENCAELWLAASDTTYCCSGQCIPKQEKCEDGTPYGQCSQTKPLYCQDGKLIDNCQQCGCEEGEACQPDGTCKKKSQHPVLLFSSKDIPMLREKVKSGEAKRLWNLLKSKADYYLTLDPNRVWDYANSRSLGNILRYLAFAYVISGDEEYGRKAIDFLIAWSTNKISDYPYYPYWQGHYHNIGDILLAVSLAYDWTYNLMTQEQRDIVAGAITELMFGEYTNSYKLWWGVGERYNNWLGVKAGGFGLAGLAVRNDSPRATKEIDNLIQRAKELIVEYMDVNFGVDGEAYEGIGYGGYGLKPAITFATALKNIKGEDIYSGSNAVRFIEHMVYSLLPLRDCFNQLDNSWCIGSSAYVAWMMSHFPDNGLSKWLWNEYFSKINEIELDLAIIWYNDRAALTNPSTILPDVKNFRTRGLIYYRSAWRNKNDILSSFDAKQMRIIEGGKKTLSKYHLHNDVTDFTLYAYGGRFAIPPGYEFRGSQATEAHNNVLIDGVGQSTMREGKLLSFMNNKNYALAIGDAKLSYPGVMKANRYYGIIKQPYPYFICIDDIQKDQNMHEYEWLLQTDAANRIYIDGQNAIINSTNSSLSLYFSNPVTISLDPQEYKYSTGQAKRLRAKLKAIDPYFFVSMIPRNISMLQPNISKLDSASTIGMEIEWYNVTQYILFGKGDKISGFDFESDAKLLIANKNANTFLMYNGTYLQRENKTLIQIDGQKASVGLSFNKIEVFGNVNFFKIYAPNAKEVYVNSEGVEFGIEDGYVIYPFWGEEDLNNDGIVNIFDLVIVAKRYGAKPTNPNWNSKFDLEKDNRIDEKDLLRVVERLKWVRKMRRKRHG
ncbi:MAG: hypothetical protein DRP03_03215, partial [Candidatus Aenigmatarchaeota archaeon]